MDEEPSMIRRKGDVLLSIPLYFDRAFDDPTNLIAETRMALAKTDFDTMVGTGLSGALVIPILARALGKHFLIVRKHSEHTHSSRPAEGRLGKRWIFVDDMIASGETRERVTEVVGYVASAHEFETTYCGTLLYSPNVTFSPRR